MRSHLDNFLLSCSQVQNINDNTRLRSKSQERPKEELSKKVERIEKKLEKFEKEIK